MTEEIADDDPEWYDDNKEVLTRAMLKAKQAFDRFINDELGLDGTYFDLSMKGYILERELEDVLGEVIIPAEIETSMKRKYINKIKKDIIGSNVKPRQIEEPQEISVV